MGDLRIIVVAPTGRDANLICELLHRSGFDALPASDCASAVRAAEEGIGAFLLADEILTPATVALFGELVASQPTWSDLPIIVLTSSGHATPVSDARSRMRLPLGNIILVERPVRPETLISTVQSAIRARGRQYQAREHANQEKLAADALRKSEKLAVAGRLAASIAHEINNPLEAVTNLHFLMKSAKSLEQAKQYLEIAERELQRVTEITTQTLRFYRESSKAAAVNIAGVLDSVLKLYDRRLHACNIKVCRRFEPTPEFIGYGGEIRQVIANLVSNALDAMSAGGKLIIHVSQVTQHHDGLHKGIRIVVADTGAGIPTQLTAKVLEPFVSTKQDTGTGLGLWVTSEIVRKHGGQLRFRSKVGKGTVFSIFLPLQTPSVANTSSAGAEMGVAL